MLKIPAKIRRYVARLLCTAMLFAALAPAISMAQAPGNVRWVELCTAVGLARVAVVDTAIDTDTPATGDGATHCPFCRTHADDLALPAAAVPAPPELALDTAFITDTGTTAPPPRYLRPAPARAPPFPS
ncbi:MAG: DUF2946 domain-containing protein [Gammaproteobacteria bacterium]|nr:DUF2946 domain-containing protein [Gammaproteobacteria bacterium]